MGEIVNFTDGLPEQVPTWASNRTGRNTGFKFVWSLILPMSLFYKWLMQGLDAWAPGGPGATATALTLTGQSRGLIQGRVESNADYAARLRAWVGPEPYTDDTWSNMGATKLLARDLAAYLGSGTTVRVIERIYSDSGTPMGRWVTANPDGTFGDVVAAWDWDSAGGWTDPDRTYAGTRTRQFWSDFWIVVTPPPWSVTGGTGRGQAVPAAEHDAILGMLEQYKGAHTFCRAIIWSYDATKFTPTNPTVDGSYGNWGKYDGAGNLVAARDPSARYWIPPLG